MKHALFAAVVAMSCLLPLPAGATAKFSTEISDFNGYCDCEDGPVGCASDCFNTTMKIKASTTSAEECLDSGTFAISDGTKKVVQVVTLDPPFSGSASASNYVTYCSTVSGASITFLLKVELTNCALWICETSYSAEVAIPSSSFSTKRIIDYFVSAILGVEFRDPTGENVCVENTDCE